mmetsp:Transcript_31441/g.79872  ORF Transcript_31441/g.79872 Transcript_31441/m.79872 type:complete len:584 (-) Transcript_31441:2844-4595(-)
MHADAHLHALSPRLCLGKLDVPEEALGNALEGVRGPHGEPVDGAAVDERGKLAEAGAEGVADGREGEHDVKVALAAVEEEGPRLGGGVESAPGGLGAGADLLAEAGLLVGREDVGDLGRVEEVVDVLNKALELDLRVGEEEHSRLAVASCDSEQPLDVLAPLVLPVGLGDFDGDDRVVHDKGGQLRARLPAAPPDPDQERVAAGGAEHAADAGDVLDHEEEEDELHRLLGHGVVVLEKGVADLNHLLGVLHLLVQPLAVALGVPKVAEEEAARLRDADVAVVLGGQEVLKDLVEVKGEVLLEGRSHKLDEPVTVLVVGEAVVKDAHHLVHPQAAGRGAFGHGLGVGHEEPEDDPAKVAEVEQVVRLGGRRQQVGERRVVHFEGALDDGLAQALDGPGSALLLKLEAHDGVKDARHGLSVKLRDRDDIEPAEEARSDKGAAAAGGPHGAHVHHVHDVAEGLLLEVIPAIVVHILPEDLDGGLCAVLLLGGHVQVVDKDHSLLTHWGPVDALAALVHGGVDDVLRLIGARGGAEGHLLWLERVRHALAELLVHYDRLASARGPAAQHRVAVLDEEGEHGAAPDRV